MLFDYLVVIHAKGKACGTFFGSGRDSIGVQRFFAALMVKFRVQRWEASVETLAAAMVLKCNFFLKVSRMQKAEGEYECGGYEATGLGFSLAVFSHDVAF